MVLWAYPSWDSGNHSRVLGKCLAFCTTVLAPRELVLKAKELKCQNVFHDLDTFKANILLLFSEMSIILK